MPNVRNTRITSAWAEVTTPGGPGIPGSPATGGIYRWNMMSAMSPIGDNPWLGQKYFTRGDSARLNGALWTITSIVRDVEQWGILPWSDQAQPYSVGSITMSPAGKIVVCIQAHVSAVVTTASPTHPDSAGVDGGAAATNPYWRNFVQHTQIIPSGGITPPPSDNNFYVMQNGTWVPQAQSDWVVTNTTSASYILNKPDVVLVPTGFPAGSPLVWNMGSGWAPAPTGGGLAPPASDGVYYVIRNGAWVPQVQANWTETNTTAPAYILNKPTNLVTVPTGFPAGSPLVWNMGSGWAPSPTGGGLAPPASDGIYYVIRNGAWTPQIQSNWTETITSSPAYIYNKPTLVPFPPNDGEEYVMQGTTWIRQVQSDWNVANTSDSRYIRNKPAIGGGGDSFYVSVNGTRIPPA